jgi:hypothetical protein
VARGERADDTHRGHRIRHRKDGVAVPDIVNSIDGAVGDEDPRDES